jgi:quercetin dioxygenase-like cupin family protein
MVAALLVGMPAIGVTAQQVGVFYPNIPGELLVENEHVVVQRFIIEPGQWEGIHSHPGNQIAVRIKGGLWAGRRGGREVSRRAEPTEDGSVGWMEAIDISQQHESGNVGDTPIDLIWITLKSCAPMSGSSHDVVQVYPNVPAEVLLDNERVVVQRFVTQPGEWQGVHSHPGNQVYVHVEGGEWTIRRDGVDTVSPAEIGSAGWWDRVDLSEAHDTANSGDTPIVHILVNLKPCGSIGR